MAGLGEFGVIVRTTGDADDLKSKNAESAAESPVSVASAEIVVESPVEEVEMPIPAARPRPRVAQRVSAETQEGRKSISFGLFGKGSSSTASEVCLFSRWSTNSRLN